MRKNRAEAGRSVLGFLLPKSKILRIAFTNK